jgi:hypothetical protein
VPEDGACLMEYVSVLAGRPFSDHPRCTDPTLAELARLVNDASTDEGRPRLAVLAPTLAERPPADPARTAAIVHAAVAAAYEAAGEPVALCRHLRRAQRRHERVLATHRLAGLARLADPLHRQGAARRRLEAAVEALRDLPDPQHDAALRAVLQAGIDAAAGASAAGAPHRPVAAPAGSPAGELVDH